MIARMTRRQFSQRLLAAAALPLAGSATAMAAAGAGRRKVIFDTDPGIDDAMALLFLNALPEIDLIGITTTFGNAAVETTTRNALYLTERFGIAAPVASGAPNPFVGTYGPAPVTIHGKNGLGDIPLPDRLTRRADPRPAARFLIDSIRAHPGEVTLVAVGSLNNLARALREDPGIASLTRQVIIMGGAIGYGGILGNVTPAAEANIWDDPTAADEVFGAAWPLTAVGLDVTEKVEMSRDYLDALRRDGGEAGQFIWDITRLYEKFHHDSGVPNIFVHDASAVAYLARPDLFKTRSGPVRVATEGLAFGETIQKPAGRSGPPSVWDNRPAQNFCIDVDAEALRRLYRQTILDWQHRRRG
jgi:inosine-uridine nucleoside N-ribohydrolase